MKSTENKIKKSRSKKREKNVLNCLLFKVDLKLRYYYIMYLTCAINKI